MIDAVMNAVDDDNDIKNEVINILLALKREEDTHKIYQEIHQSYRTGKGEDPLEIELMDCINTTLPKVQSLSQHITL